MHFREAKRKADNPFKREAKVIGGLILLLGIIALVAIFFGPHVN
jgi:flavin reductase (DIM6/NTAB) family NADH-FMN oxidoreductase RutF